MRCPYPPTGPRGIRSPNRRKPGPGWSIALNNLSALAMFESLFICCERFTPFPAAGYCKQADQTSG
jgi:hypothetical protein